MNKNAYYLTHIPSKIESMNFSKPRDLFMRFLTGKTISGLFWKHFSHNFSSQSQFSLLTSIFIFTTAHYLFHNKHHQLLHSPPTTFPQHRFQNMDFRVLEEQKENIQPLPTGRSALKLATALTERRPLSQQREEFELKLSNIDELDDPLQLYIDFIQWTHNHYPQGSNAESGLLTLLERCTSCFRDTAHYKNDPRYLRVWFEYAGYSDLPRDIFVYLAKKAIGSQLALYYEEFARFLELKGQFVDSQEVYEIGIERDARPVLRLRRSFQHFKERKHIDPVPKVAMSNVSTMRSVLSAKSDHSPKSKRPKLQIFEDTDSPSIKSVFGGDNPRPLAPLALRTKENAVAAKPWAGEVFKQNNDTDKPPPVKFEVFKDSETPEFEAVTENGSCYTVIHQPGKPTEKLCVNMKLVYPSSDEEYCFTEILALSRKFASVSVEEPELEHNHTFTIPLRDDDTYVRPKSPTMTMFSRMTTKEVLGMFNEAAHNFQLDDDTKGFEETSTNFTGFVTETLHPMEPAQPELFLKESDQPETPPTDQYSSASSPFLESVPRFENPTSAKLRLDLLMSLNPPLATYPGYHSSDETIRNCNLLSTLARNSKVVRDSRSVISHCGEVLSLRYELGRGGYGTVFLAETEKGEFKALKVESPATCWEYYILHAVHQRLPDSVRNRVISPEAIYKYQDESYLVLNYVTQGTILDVVNMYADQNELVDEVVCLYLTTILLQIVENLHSVGIIHGDLKADNCMVNFESTSVLSDVYSPTDANWAKKGLIAIDFGRAIDLNLFENPESVQFVSEWDADEQDCPQMAKGEPWRFEADYYGIAAIVHTMLFGRYIEVRSENGRYKLKGLLKRYWQSHLWEPLFDLLLNPYSKSETGPGNSKARIAELQSQRLQLQNWLGDNSVSRKLRFKVMQIEHELVNRHKKLMSSCI